MPSAAHIRNRKPRDAAQESVGVAELRVFHQQTAENIHFHVGPWLRDLAQHLHRSSMENSGSLIEVAADADGQPIENFAPRRSGQMTVRHRSTIPDKCQDIFHGFVCLPLNIVTKIGADYARNWRHTNCNGLSTKHQQKETGRFWVVSELEFKFRLLEGKL